MLSNMVTSIFCQNYLKLAVHISFWSNSRVLSGPQKHTFGITRVGFLADLQQLMEYGCFTAAGPILWTDFQLVTVLGTRTSAMNSLSGC